MSSFSAQRPERAVPTVGYRPHRPLVALDGTKYVHRGVQALGAEWGATAAGVESGPGEGMGRHLVGVFSGN